MASRITDKRKAQPVAQPVAQLTRQDIDRLVGQPERWYTWARAAAVARRSVTAMRQLRIKGKGPAFRKVDGRLMTSATDLDRWMPERNRSGHEQRLRSAKPEPHAQYLPGPRPRTRNNRSTEQRLLSEGSHRGSHRGQVVAMTWAADFCGPLVPEWSHLVQDEPRLAGLEAEVTAQKAVNGSYCANRAWRGHVALQEPLRPAGGYQRNAPKRPTRAGVVCLADVAKDPATLEAQRQLAELRQHDKTEGLEWLRSSEAYDVGYHHLYNLLPDCQRCGCQRSTGPLTDSLRRPRRSRHSSEGQPPHH